ncbi:unnamed protein product [Cladocopium goreaui]|uniref:C3H1-type domain-containing protein n=1 Tax=Cladocopium goreaui TaxID=2562237 RepID=A0A9P1FKN0_9DINO|nr:unnamed protein product [Cladocopium goreaui]
MCNAPCVHMLKNGSCHLGFACGFCHFVHGRKKKLDKSQRSILQEADTGQRLAIILPHIIQKMAQLADPEVGKLAHMLRQQLQLVTESSRENNDNFHKKLRQVQIHRSLERMNCSALFDLAMPALPENILQTFAAVQSQMFPFLSPGEQMVLPEGSVLKFWL